MADCEWRPLPAHELQTVCSYAWMHIMPAQCGCGHYAPAAAPWWLPFGHALWCKSCMEGSRLRLAGSVLVPVDVVRHVTELLLMLEAARAVSMALSCHLAGNVLVPVDAAGHMTELLLMLEAARAGVTASSRHLAGNVLVPVDAAGRVLELLLVLEAAWAGARPGYGLALLSPVAFNALEFAKSQLEWMAEGLTHSLERSKANPFALRCAVNLEPKTYYRKPQPGAQQDP